MNEITYILFVCLAALVMLITFMVQNIIKLQRQKHIIKSNERKI